MSDRRELARQRAIASVKKALDVVEQEIRDLMLRLPSRDGMLESEAMALQSATRIRQQIIAALRSRGVEVMRSAFDDALTDAAAMALNDLQLGSFASTVAPELERILEPRSFEAGDAMSGRSLALSDIVRQRMASGAPVSKLIGDLKEQLQMTLSQIETIVDTTISAVYQQAKIEQGLRMAGLEKIEAMFEYVGPSSGRVLRKFCAGIHTELTRNVYTIDAINRMNNGEGQPKPVSAFCGGYNCRHQFIPISIEAVEERGLRIVR